MMMGPTLLFCIAFAVTFATAKSAAFTPPQGNANNVYGKISSPGSSTSTVFYLGDFDSAAAMFATAKR